MGTSAAPVPFPTPLSAPQPAARFVLEKRSEWVTYPETDPAAGITWNAAHVGFAMRVLANPSGKEVREEMTHYLASNGADMEAQDAYWQHVAPRITEWNLQVIGPDGDPVDLDPPAVDWTVLLALPFDLAMWIRQIVHWSHRRPVLNLLQGQGETGASDGN